MREVIRGHLYDLDNLKDRGTTELAFYMDPELHGGQKQTGPSCQEVIRAVIARVKSLHEEKPHPRNAKILHHLRSAIVEFEMRALELKVEKGEAIEEIPTGFDGHIFRSKE